MLQPLTVLCSLLLLFLTFSVRSDASELTICIDPGHPSESGSGTTGRHITEIDAAWNVAQILKNDLVNCGFRVVLTKQSSEAFVTNQHRAEIANSAHASLMIRLHCDADAGTGIASYAPDEQGTVRGFTGPDAEVIKLSQNALKNFHPVMIRSLDGLLADRGMFSDRSTRIGGKQGALTGSIYSKVPVILVEMCVLTNPHDEAIIDSAAGQRRIAAALAAGVEAAVQPHSTH